jgi:hypothetical protein
MRDQLIIYTTFNEREIQFQPIYVLEIRNIFANTHSKISYGHVRK